MSSSKTSPVACRLGLHDYRLKEAPARKYQPSGRPIFEKGWLVCSGCGKEKS